MGVYGTISQVFQPSILYYIYRKSAGYHIEIAYIYMSVSVVSFDCAGDLSRVLSSKPLDDTESRY
jgi:hypothetical protein